MPLVFINPSSGLTDLPESLCAADQYATSQIFEAIAGNAALGATKIEVFVGDYFHGDTVPLPVSPIDNYAYNRDECLYPCCLRYGFNAQTGRPSEKGAALLEDGEVDPDTGAVYILRSYYVQGGEQHNTNDGILRVWTIAVRGRKLGTSTATSIVQSAFNYSLMGTGMTVTLPAVPTDGNTLLAIACLSDPYENPTIGLPAGFATLASYSPVLLYRNATIVGSRLVQPGDGTDWAFTTNIDGSARFSGFYLFELAGQPNIMATAGSAGPPAPGGTPGVITTGAPGSTGTQLVIVLFCHWAGLNITDFAPAGLTRLSGPGYPNDFFAIYAGVVNLRGPCTAVDNGGGQTDGYAMALSGAAAGELGTTPAGSLLKLAAVPSPYDQPSGVWATDDPLRDDYLTALLSGSKYSVVDVEVFRGRYSNGQAVPLQVSPVDGYEYSRAELTYFANMIYTGKPDRSRSSGPGRIKRKQCSVNSSTGVVSSTVTYYDGSTTTDTNDGIVEVTVFAQRARTYANSFTGEASAWNDVDDAAWLSGAVLSTSHYHELTQNVRFATEGIEIYVGVYGDGDTVPLPTGRNDPSYTYSRPELTYLFAGADSGSLSGAALLNETILVDPATGLVSYVSTTNVDGGGNGTTTSPQLLVFTFAARQAEVSVAAATPVDDIPSDQNVDGTSLANQALADLTQFTVNGT